MTDTKSTDPVLSQSESNANPQAAADSELNNQSIAEPGESFGDIFTEYEKSHKNRREGGRQLEGIVVTVTADSVLVDIGFKSEGMLPLSAFREGENVKPGDKLLVSVKGRDPEGYYELSRFKTELPKDWPALERAFTEKAAIAGTVTGVIKGGVSVDVGVRAFMPASRSGVREAAELEKLVGQEIRCRIIKLDVAEEDVVVDRRVLAEEEERSVKERRYGEVKEGETLLGEVRSLTDYGAFVDLGGVDALLHISDIAWSRVNKPADVLTPGQQIQVRVLKVDPDKRRISVGMKQLQAHPWDSIAGKLKPGERVRGTVVRVMEFGAFVELEPGVEGLIHVSEMSWAKKVRIASDVLKPGETVEAVILGVNATERRISLGLKQTLGDPWSEVPAKFPVGSVVEGPVTNLQKFGAFVQLAEGVEGMIHISDMSVDKKGKSSESSALDTGEGTRRINHPQDVLRVGQLVKAQVLAIDQQKRQLRLGMKQLIPSGLDEYIAEHKEGDVVTGRVVERSQNQYRVELGEGVLATCRITEAKSSRESGKESQSEAKADLSSLTAMLQARWKSGATTDETKPDAVHTGQIRDFRIARLEAASKTIELTFA
jgi:small subunit ribosomal protein S1